MFSKVSFFSKFLAIISLLYLGTGCAVSNQSQNISSNSSDQRSVTSKFALPVQTASPKSIQSVQLHLDNAPGQAPIITLNSNQQLVLSFDYLGTQSRQFRVEVSHRTQRWKESSITPSTYLQRFSYDYIQNAKSSFANSPSYRHVAYSFPNDKLRPAVSGNYLLEVYDNDDGKLLFRMPFFVTEDTGQIRTQIDRLFAKRSDGRPVDQPSSTYQYPRFVEYPQFDLSMSFAQNQFWGQMRKADYTDTINSNTLSGRLKADHSFIGNYEFKTLDLQHFEADGQEILEYNPGQRPPGVTLSRDIQRFDSNPKSSPLSNIGRPSSKRDSKYAQVQFSLVTDPAVSPDTDIFIVGDFNNWIISDLYQMKYDSSENLWKGKALIKQGRYAYKYVVVNGGINDLALDQLLVSSAQEYFTFIYFKDPNKNFDRLLKVSRTVKRRQ